MSLIAIKADPAASESVSRITTCVLPAPSAVARDHLRTTCHRHQISLWRDRLRQCVQDRLLYEHLFSPARPECHLALSSTGRA
jgi:hypothetical protein